MEKLAPRTIQVVQHAKLPQRVHRPRQRNTSACLHYNRFSDCRLARLPDPRNFIQPDFVGQQKAVAEQWAQANGVSLNEVAVASNQPAVATLDDQLELDYAQRLPPCRTTGGSRQRTLRMITAAAPLPVLGPQAALRSGSACPRIAIPPQECATVRALHMVTFRTQMVSWRGYCL